MQNFIGLCMSIVLLPLAGIASETAEAKQYNAVAKKYSEMVVENNQGSIAAYFRNLVIPLNGKRVLDLGCGDGYDLSRIKFFLNYGFVAGIPL